MNALLLLLAAALAVVAWWIGRQARRGSLPGEVIYDDTVEQTERVLVSHRYRLKGKPDHVLRTRSGVVPVEKKSKDWQGRLPLPGDRAQLLAYCLLVEEAMAQPVNHGLLHYANREFIVPFGAKERQEIIDLLQAMQAARCARYVARSHSHAGKCRSCGVRAACGEAVA